MNSYIPQMIVQNKTLNTLLFTGYFVLAYILILAIISKIFPNIYKKPTKIKSNKPKRKNNKPKKKIRFPNLRGYIINIIILGIVTFFSFKIIKDSSISIYHLLALPFAIFLVVGSIILNLPKKIQNKFSKKTKNYKSLFEKLAIMSFILVVLWDFIDLFVTGDPTAVRGPRLSAWIIFILPFVFIGYIISLFDKKSKKKRKKK